MKSDLLHARLIRNSCLLLYLTVFAVAAGLWFFVIVFGHLDIRQTFPIIAAAGVLVGIFTTYLTFPILCPKCRGHFFSESNAFFGSHALTRCCRHCGLRL